MPEPIVSVTIPCYNAGHFVGEAIESVLGQTLQNFEIVLIDDGSTDNTREIIAQWTGDSRVRYIYQPNGGVSNALNHALREARGEYVYILGADDLILPECLEWFVGLMRRENTKWVFTDLIRREGDVDKLESGYMPQDNALEYALVKRFPARATCYHRQTLMDVTGGYNESLFVCEDWDLYARLLKAGIPFSYLDKPGYIYQIQPVSLTKGSSFIRNLDVIYKIYLIHYLPLIGENKAIREAYSQYMWHMASAYYQRRTRYGRILVCLVRSTAAQPSRMLAFIRKKLGFV